jgi:hypothetical protein
VSSVPTMGLPRSFALANGRTRDFSLVQGKSSTPFLPPHIVSISRDFMRIVELTE